MVISTLVHFLRGFLHHIFWMNLSLYIFFFFLSNIQFLEKPIEKMTYHKQTIFFTKQGTKKLNINHKSWKPTCNQVITIVPIFFNLKEKHKHQP
jgi:hypothetical protein